MASDFYSMSLQDLLDRQEAKRQLLLKSGVNPREVSQVMNKNSFRVMQFLDKHSELIEPADLSMMKSEAKFMAYSGFGAAITAGVLFSFIGPLTRYKFNSLPTWARYTLRTSFLLVPSVFIFINSKRKALKLRLYLENKYEKMEPAVC